MPRVTRMKSGVRASVTTLMTLEKYRAVFISLGLDISWKHRSIETSIKTPSLPDQIYTKNAKQSKIMTLTKPLTSKYYQFSLKYFYEPANFLSHCVYPLTLVTHLLKTVHKKRFILHKNHLFFVLFSPN